MGVNADAYLGALRLPPFEGEKIVLTFKMKNMIKFEHF